MAKKVALCLANLGKLDNGASRLAIDRGFSELVRDLEDRGDDEKERTLTIKLKAKKVKGVIVAAVEVGTTLPALRTNSTVAEISMANGKPELCFQPDNAERHDQPTFLKDDEEEAAQE